MKKLYIILFFVLLLNSRSLFSQKVVVCGTLYSKDEAVPNASIYIAGSSVGTVSDKKGEFKLVTSLKPPFRLVVRHIDYRDTILNILQTKTQIHIALRASINPLPEVIISSGSTQKYRSLFKEALLGFNRFSSQCEITNIEKINFSYNRQTNLLKARSVVPIIVDNNALGYEVDFLLKSFVYNVATKNYHYSGTAFFHSKTGSSQKQKVWTTNRTNAFKVTQKYFLETLLKNNDTFFFNRYKIRRAKKERNKKKAKLKEKLQQLKSSEAKEGFRQQMLSMSDSIYMPLFGFFQRINDFTNFVKKKRYFSYKAYIVDFKPMIARPIFFPKEKTFTYFMSNDRKDYPIILGNRLSENIRVEEFWAHSNLLSLLLPLDYAPE